MFGTIYSKTVATYPKTIFVVAGSMALASIVVLLLLRPDALIKPRRKGKRVTPGALEARVEPLRGRSRKSKDLRRPSVTGALPEGLPVSQSSLRASNGQGAQSYGATSSSLGSGSALLSGTSYEGRST